MSASAPGPAGLGLEHEFPVIKSVWIGLLAWTAIRLIDLGMAIYTNSEHLQPRRNLSDMIVPTARAGPQARGPGRRALREVYLIGSGEWVTRLLAGLGLVGLAASLAAQDTLKNFFGTLLLIGEHPFKIGDFIVVNTMEGTVESVGFRSTWIRTPEDSLITIPNSIIANASIDNRGARQYRRYRTFVGLDYDTPLDRLVALRDGLRDYAAAHPLIRADKDRRSTFTRSRRRRHRAAGEPVLQGRDTERGTGPRRADPGDSRAGQAVRRRDRLAAQTMLMLATPTAAGPRDPRPITGRSCTMAKPAAPGR